MIPLGLHKVKGIFSVFSNYKRDIKCKSRFLCALLFYFIQLASHCIYINVFMYNIQTWMHCIHVETEHKTLLFHFSFFVTIFLPFIVGFVHVVPLPPTHSVIFFLLNHRFIYSSRPPPIHKPCNSPHIGYKDFVV